MPDLTPQELEASTYIFNTIYNDRTMLQYLKTYQQQPIMSTLNAETSSWFIKTIAIYQNMLDTQYGKGLVTTDIVDACYGDTNNLETRCIQAANQVKQTRQGNQQYIDFANSMSATCIKTADNKTECWGSFFEWNIESWATLDGVSGYKIDTLATVLL